MLAHLGEDVAFELQVACLERPALESLRDVVQCGFGVAVVVIIERTEIICIVHGRRFCNQLVEGGVDECAFAVVYKVCGVLELVVDVALLCACGDRRARRTAC